MESHHSHLTLEQDEVNAALVLSGLCSGTAFLGGMEGASEDDTDRVLMDANLAEDEGSTRYMSDRGTDHIGPGSDGTSESYRLLAHKFKRPSKVSV